ncbi:MAG TPA: gliding motility-associated ABC transporter substrate-binding protein GldG [Bacteroidales bacterium]|nr:gliding motility-associated ABC transporter substrate-binding protein GldG [Bacteroidales bacterium]HPS74322.1 gliding motility-associated ABC transporter substrate-binding protein GldG [Bacteroidales bacterium]
MAKSEKRNIKRSNIGWLLLGVAAILLLNIISSFVFTRFDLTAEKRYSLSPATRDLLKKTDDIVFFKVYLEGDLPPGFRRLANETREMLDEFRAYNSDIQFEFVNPSENPKASERNEVYKQLVEQGLQPTDLRLNQKGESRQLIIFPGAIVSYKGREVPVQLLMSQLNVNSEKVLNNSIQALEYNLASAIEKLTTKIKPAVAIIEGQGELSKAETIDLEQSMLEYYQVDRVTIGQQINSLAIRLKGDTVHEPLVNKYKAIIIDKPVKPFDEKDKFLIDQFIMRGGRVLWLIDPVFASMDSLEKYNTTMGIANDINLEDMLFSYGVRLSTSLVMDLYSLKIPLTTGMIGNQPQIEFFPWYFFPLATPVQGHPIVNGLNAIKTEFVSVADTVEVPGIKKTILLTTSPYSRTVNVPALIDLQILSKEPDREQFSQGPQPVAVLLEGSFTSAFQFRIPPELAQNQALGFREKSKPTKMVVIADGDVAKNQFHYRDGYPLPLGFDQYTRETFGNKDLLMNVMNYLTDDSGLISVRSRELKLRQLDTARLTDEKIYWQLLNIFGPLLIIGIFGFVKLWIRRRKYAPKHHLTLNDSK